MGKILYSLLLNLIILSATFNFVDGVTLPTTLLYLVMAFFGLAVGLMLEKPALKFLTVSRNFLTSTLMSALILFGIMYLMDTVLPQIAFESMTFNGFDIGALTINSFELTKLTTMALASILAAGTASLLTALKRID